MISPDLNNNIETPLYKQLYDFIKQEIAENNLKKNQKLPSKRNLSEHLNISVNTVTKSYEMLLDEGYIYSKERCGYFVSNIENLLKIEKAHLDEEENRKVKYRYNFRINNIDNSYFPVYTFKKISARIMTGNREELLEERNPQGILKLRKSIKNYLYDGRAVKTEEKNIIISSGTEYLLQILFYILPENSKFAVENPGYKIQSEIFKLNRIPYEKIDVDLKGMIYEELEKTDCNIVFLTPSHQFPTGAVMPVSRRIQFLNWANKKAGNYIIEDDYDSEFRYKNKPIPALKSLDQQDNVIYIGNFSKSITSTVRLSYMVLPDRLLKRYYEIMPFINCPVSNIVQLSISDFIDNGYFERHLNKMRNIYSKKRERAIELLKRERKVKIIDSKAGLHFIAEIDTLSSEKKISQIMADNGIYVQGLEDYYYNEKNYRLPRIIIGYGGMSIPELEEGIGKFREIIKNM